MKSDFYFLVVPENRKKHSIQMRAMHMMAAILILVYAIYLVPFWNETWMEVVAFIPAAIGIFIFVLWKKEEVEHAEINRILRILEIGCLSMAAWYFYQEAKIIIAGFYLLVAFFLLALLFLENRIFGEHFIQLTEERITIPMLIGQQKFTWDKIKNVVVKYNLFTLQLEDDQMVQRPIYHLYDASELAQFQEFLNKQLL